MKHTALAASLLVCVGCAEQQKSEATNLVATHAASLDVDDVVATAAFDLPTCLQMGVAALSLSGTVTVPTLAEVSISTSLDGDDFEDGPVLAESDFQSLGSAGYEAIFNLTLYATQGDHTVETCVTVDGDTSCLDAIDVTVNCDFEDVPDSEVDDIAPVISYTRTPEPNTYGWNNTDIALEFECADANSEVASCPGPMTVSLEGLSQSVSVTATDPTGNVGSLTVTDLSIDKTAPSIAASVTPAANTAGWNSTSVVVSFVCADGLSGVQTCPASQVLTAESAALSASGTAIDYADNTTSATASVKIDKTAPTVSYSGTLTYSADQTVAITCSATDALSGVASTTCSNVSGAAYSLGAGTHSLSATATDAAGNVGSGSTSYRVTVTTASICTVTGTLIANAGVANSLCVKLRNAQRDIDRGSYSAASGILGAYENEVAAQTGKWISVSNVSILIALSDALQAQLI